MISIPISNQILKSHSKSSSVNEIEPTSPIQQSRYTHPSRKNNMTSQSEQITDPKSNNRQSQSQSQPQSQSRSRTITTIHNPQHEQRPESCKPTKDTCKQITNLKRTPICGLARQYAQRPSTDEVRDPMRWMGKWRKAAKMRAVEVACTQPACEFQRRRLP
jgi:FtsZ-interacting cell division protein ZipA